MFGYLVGQVMKAMAGKGNPALVNEALKKQLSAGQGKR
jgi:aspartyl-tRNA(Asn)/glutamyl-tRNA(Gln) amidotransferase subunit B